jgi:hypothetical protein
MAGEGTGSFLSGIVQEQQALLFLLLALFLFLQNSIMVHQWYKT